MAALRACPWRAVACVLCRRVTRAVFAALSSTRDCLSNQLATGVLCFIAGAEDLEEGQARQQGLAGNLGCVYLC